MCTTPWCWGDCEQCIAEQKYEQQFEESNAECPYRKECKWVSVCVKQDKCSSCGKVTNY